MDAIGKLLMGLAVLLFVTGALIWGIGRLGGNGLLPGDIVYRGRNTTVIFPVVTMIVVSVVLTILLNLFLRGRGR
jgi:hypothetical protein